MERIVKRFSLGFQIGSKEPSSVDVNSIAF
jgi:hypothetical protein